MAYYNYNGGKLVGKIYSFDGEVGSIITPQGEYQFTLKDANNIDEITKGTMVEFYPNIVPFGESKYNFARDINSIKLEDSMNLKKEKI